MTFRDLHQAVFSGEPVDEILWQPRIEHWYETHKLHGTLPERYREMTILDLFDDLHCSVRGYWAFNDSIRIEDSEEVRREVATSGEQTITTEYTPAGTLTMIETRTPLAWHTEKYPVETPEDMRVMEWKLRHRRIWFDREYFDGACRRIRERAAPCIYISRVNLMRLVHEYMGVEGGLIAVYEWPEATERLLRTINETDEALLDVLCASPIEIINFGDNVHQAYCPPPLFEQWVLPEYQYRNEVLHAAGKRTYPHWDGDCGQLLPYVADCGFDGFEAITPVPQGDVTLEEMRDTLEGHILLDGIPCTDFLPETPVESLLENTEKCIEYFAPRLILGISDELSPVGDIERVRMVSEFIEQRRPVQAATGGADIA
ncbi:MAG: hypothetical protein HYV26_12185 [Candidatus Hydrogenedentes bacterium]|nr:hypothetical protein [Candidatus Hydrogenedentota bacterium]